MENLLQDEQNHLTRNELEQVKKALAREEEINAMLMAIILQSGKDAALLMRNFIAQADETEGWILAAVKDDGSATVELDNSSVPGRETEGLLREGLWWQSWWPCKVVKMFRDGRAMVQWDYDKSTSILPPHALRPTVPTVEKERTGRRVAKSPCQ